MGLARFTRNAESPWSPDPGRREEGRRRAGTTSEKGCVCVCGEREGGGMVDGWCEKELWTRLNRQAASMYAEKPLIQGRCRLQHRADHCCRCVRVLLLLSCCD